jgi:hypothetical protein
MGLPGDALSGDPTGVLFDWVNSAFFFTYVSFRIFGFWSRANYWQRDSQILLQIPFTVLSKYYNPRIWIGCSAILWGICSTSMVCGLYNLVFMTRDLLRQLRILSLV